MEGEIHYGSKKELYEDLVRVKVVDFSREKLKEKDIFVFSVTPDFTVYLSDRTHEFLAEKYGVDRDTALTEGYVDTREKPPKIQFKFHPFQPYPGFTVTKEDLLLLQEAIQKNILFSLESNESRE